MKDSRKTLLSLVRSALWGTPADDVTPDTDWSKVYTLASQQTLIGLLADAVQKLPQELRPDAQIVRQLQVFMIRNIQAHGQISRNLALTVELLRSHDIESVLFKGHGLALNYPDPMTRQCGDIDLYVGKEAAAKAAGICLASFGEGEHDAESSKHFHFDNEGIDIEIHKIAENLPGLNEDRRYQEWTVRHLTGPDCRKVEIAGTEINLPPVAFDAIYILNHTWHHFVNGGIGLRQVCDWTLYLHKFHKNIDVVQLKEDLKSFGLLKVWHYFSYIAVNHLGLPESECPLYSNKYASASERVFDVIWNEGNFGRHSKNNKTPRPKGYAAGKLHSFKKITMRFFSIFRVYPSYMLKSWLLYFTLGIYHYFKGFKG